MKMEIKEISGSTVLVLYHESKSERNQLQRFKGTLLVNGISFSEVGENLKFNGICFGLDPNAISENTWRIM